jgi:hypothetical protein
MAMEPLSLCNYCCSPRNKQKQTPQTPQTPSSDEMKIGYEIQSPIESKYMFGHATHYTYCVTTPRLLCEFETGTPS